MSKFTTFCSIDKNSFPRKVKDIPKVRNHVQTVHAAVQFSLGISSLNAFLISEKLFNEEHSYTHHIKYLKPAKGDLAASTAASNEAGTFITKITDKKEILVSEITSTNKNGGSHHA